MKRGPSLPLSVRLRHPPVDHPGRWATALVLLVVLCGGGLAFAMSSADNARCGEPVVRPSELDDPFFSPAQMRARPDPRLNRLVAALSRWPAPFGAVVAGVGYDYGQWLTTAGLESDLGVWTAHNPVFTVLGGRGLQPRWAIQERAGQHAWDAGPDRYYGLLLSRRRPLQLTAYDVTAGRSLWCTSVGVAPTTVRGPLATLVEGGARPGLVVLSKAIGSGGRPMGQLSYLDARTGDLRWQRRLDGVVGGATVAALGHGLVVVGGRDQSALVGPPSSAADAGAVTALRVADARVRWRFRPPSGAIVHVVGTDPASGITVLMVFRHGHRASGRLVALDRSGHRAWAVSPEPGFYFDAAARQGVVLVATSDQLRGYDDRTGRLLWHRSIPGGQRFFPFGFTLDQVPVFDPGQVLLPTTGAVRLLDVDTGRWRRYPLPHSSTAYWPYQLEVTDRYVAVVTNTGAVVLRRD